MRIGLGRFHPGVLSGRSRVRRVLVERPLHDVAEHVVEPPGVRFLRPHLVIGPAGKCGQRRVLREPGQVIQLSSSEAGRRAGAARVLPLGLRRQAVELAGPAAQPLRELVGRMLGHADRRKSAVAPAEAHLDVGRGRTAQPIHQRIGFGALVRLIDEHEHQVGVPRDLVGLHPERVELDLVLRLLVGLGFGGSGSHHELARGYRRHGVADGRVGDRDLVRLGRRARGLLRPLLDARPDIAHDGHFRGVDRGRGLACDERRGGLGRGDGGHGQDHPETQVHRRQTRGPWTARAARGQGPRASRSSRPVWAPGSPRSSAPVPK